MDDTVRRGQLTYWVSLRNASESTDPRLQGNSSVSEAVPYFCTTADMESAMLSLSQELLGMGFLYPLIETERQQVNLVALVNACQEMQQLYRASVRKTNALHDQHRKNTADLNHYQTSIKGLQGQVSKKERLICEAREKERRATEESRTLGSKLKLEKDELRKLNRVMQQREAQYQREINKKEIENGWLQDHLRRLVSGGRSGGVQQPSINLSSTLPRTDRSRARWKTEASSARHEEELHKRVLGQYEAWIAQLRDENNQLKSSLLRVSSQMVEMRDKYCKADNQELLDGDVNSSMTSSAYSIDSLDNLDINLECPISKARLEETFNSNMRALQQHLEEAARKVDHNVEEKLKEDLEDLRRQLKIMEEELATYKYAVQKDDREKAEEPESSFIVEGTHVEEESILRKEKQKLMMEREALKNEKRIFSDATIRLNRERASLEAEKVELLKRQFLQNLPPTLKCDLPAGGHESGGGLSGGSIGGMFDPPQRVLAIPSITTPRESVKCIQGPPIVLGPSRLSQQQHDSNKGRGSSRRL